MLRKREAYYCFVYSFQLKKHCGIFFSIMVQSVLWYNPLERGCTWPCPGEVQNKYFHSNVYHCRDSGCVCKNLCAVVRGQSNMYSLIEQVNVWMWHDILLGLYSVILYSYLIYWPDSWAPTHEKTFYIFFDCIFFR